MDIIKLDRFPSVAAGAPAALVTDELIGKSVHALIFVMGGTVFDETHINQLRLSLDGVDLLPNINGSQLKDINEYDGFTSVADHLFYFFGDPTAPSVRGKHMGDLDCSIYDSPLEIEVDIAAGADAPTLQTWAITGVPKLDMGVDFDAVTAAHFRHLRRSLIEPTAAVSGDNYRISLGSRPGGRLRKMCFFHSNLTHVEFKKNSITKIDKLDVTLNAAIQQQFARVPQSGMYVMDRVVDGNQGEAETTVTPEGKPWFLETKITTSGADQIYTFADMHAAMPQI